VSQVFAGTPQLYCMSAECNILKHLIHASKLIVQRSELTVLGKKSHLRIEPKWKTENQCFICIFISRFVLLYLCCCS